MSPYHFATVQKLIVTNVVGSITTVAKHSFFILEQDVATV